jgi:uncharacterized protein (TIGR02996 family)
MDNTAGEQRFIDQILADPDDADVPLVYADWLDEHGHGDRAELIRTQARKSHAEGDEWQQLREREGQLIERCTAAFAEPLRQKLGFEWRRGVVIAQAGKRAGLTVADLRELARFPYLTRLDGFQHLEPAQLGRLGLCPNVKRLRLYASPYALTPGQWAALGGLAHVEELCLSSHEVVFGDGLTHVAAMSGLKELNLEDANVGDEQVAALAAATGLEVLDLSRTGVTDAGLTFLPSLTRLRELCLNHLAITDATVEALAGLPLTSLDVGDTDVKDPLACVLRFPRLRKVGLRRLTPISDRHLPELLKLPELREVDLRLTGVTRFRLARFLESTRPPWKKIRLENSIGDNYHAEQRECDAFQEFCKERGFVVDVDWE